MSGIWPSHQMPRQIGPLSNSPTMVSSAQAGNVQVRSWDAQQFSFRLLYPIMPREKFAPFFAMAIAQRGRYGTFTLPASLVGWGTPLGVATGTPVVAGTPAAGSRTLTSSGWTPSVTGILKAGDLIKTTASTKVYMVMADCNSDSGGLASISIEPSLRAAPATGSALTVLDVPFTMMLASDSVGLLMNYRYRSEFEIEMIEVL